MNRSADSPEDDYLASRPREEIAAERERAHLEHLARRWEVPSSAYDPDSPEPEPREKCSHCDGTGLARSWSAETRGDVCTWCWGGGDAA